VFSANCNSSYGAGMVRPFGGGGRGGPRRMVPWRFPPYSLVLKMAADDVESGVCVTCWTTLNQVYVDTPGWECLGLSPDWLR
jgi:hypothetical protein